jgi:phenylalanyl-tRNA synthetase beta chain
MTRENSYLRASLTPSILEVLAHNARQRVTDVAVFEVGRLYRTEKLPLASLPEEPLSIGIGLMGRRVPRAWNMEDREADFYELKGVVECLLEGLGVADYSFRAESQEHLHPGRTAALVVGDKTAGWLGEVHPEVAERYELPARAYVAELNFRVVAAAAELTAQWEPIPNVPPVVRDVAVVVGDSTTAEQVRRIMEEASGELVESIELFDVYTGEGIPEGHRSLAFTVTYRGDDTLTEQEVAAAHDELRQALLTSLDAELRS